MHEGDFLGRLVGGNLGRQLDAHSSAADDQDVVGGRQLLEKVLQHTEWS